MVKGETYVRTYSILPGPDPWVIARLTDGALSAARDDLAVWTTQDSTGHGIVSIPASQRRAPPTEMAPGLHRHMWR